MFKRQPENREVKSASLSCSIKDKNYTITLGSNLYFNCTNCDKKMEIFLRDITDWSNMKTSTKNINTYFKENGGNCIKSK